MKKLLVILMAVLIPAISFAQRGIPRSNNVSVSVKRVTETTVEKEYKTYDARVGFQQMAGLHVGAMGGVGGGVSYIGGYRFNNYIFVGAGADVFITGDVELPVYAHSRFYFSRYKWRPYIAASVGCDIMEIGLYIDSSFGVDVRVHEKFNMYFGIGGGGTFANEAGYPSLLGKIGFSF